MAFDYFLDALRSWFQYPIIVGIALCFLFSCLKKRGLRHTDSQAARSAPDSGHAYASQNSFINSNKALVFPGRTTHTRLLPRVHSFSYSFLIAAVPVRNCKSNWFLSIDSQTRSWWRRGWLRVEPEDHLERGDEDTLSDKLDCFLKRKGYDPTRYSTVWLVTSPRFLSYKSDQASFWYLYSADHQLMTVVIEVNNTFDERHIYLLPEVGNNNTMLPELSTTTKTQRRKFHHVWPKNFHVSPFNSRNGYYSVSVMDLLFPEGSPACAADHIHIAVTLLSSQRRPKLVSRIWSTSEPLDPFQTQRYRAMLFLGSWLLEGPLIYPRTVFQALILYNQHHLKMYSRPEPNVESIPRHSTAAERYIRSIFIEYLKNIINTSTKEFHLHLEDHTCTTKTNITGSTNITTLSTPNAGPKSPIYTLRILTPKFYATAVAHSSVATFLSRSLLPRIAEHRTAALLHTGAETLIGLVEHAAGYEDAAITNRSDTVFGQTSDFCRALVWSCLTFVRHSLLLSCGEGYQERPRVDSMEKCGKQQHTLHANHGCFLDGFVRRNYAAVEQVKYLSAGLATAMRERILGTIGGG